MDTELLRKYKTNKRELEMIRNRINKLYAQVDQLPATKDKVMRSSDDPPYILEHIPIDAPEPKRAYAIYHRVQTLQQRRLTLEMEQKEVEVFIQSFPEGVEKQILEMVYLDGMKQREVADQLNYTQARVSQLIRGALKDL